MIGALILGFAAGALGRLAVPDTLSGIGDTFVGIVLRVKGRATPRQG